MQAVQLYQDSSLVPATWYEPTAAGLVLACFENGATLQLEIPNVCLVDGKLDVGALVPPPMPKAKAKKKKNKAKDEKKTEGNASETKKKNKSPSLKVAKAALKAAKAKKASLAVAADKSTSETIAPAVAPTAVSTSEAIAPVVAPSVSPPAAPGKKAKSKAKVKAKGKAKSKAKAKAKKQKAEAASGENVAPAVLQDIVPPPVDADTGSIKIQLVGAHKPDWFVVQLMTKSTDKAQVLEFKGDGKVKERYEKAKEILKPLIPDGLDKVKEIPKDILVNMRSALRDTRATW